MVWLDYGVFEVGKYVYLSEWVTNRGVQARKVSKGDPLSPFLFILAAEGLNAMVVEAVEKGVF